MNIKLTLIALCSLALSQVGCVNGHLDPEVKTAVKTVVTSVDGAACNAMVAVFHGPEIAGLVCQDGIPVLNELLGGLKAGDPSACQLVETDAHEYVCSGVRDEYQARVKAMRAAASPALRRSAHK